MTLNIILLILIVVVAFAIFTMFGGETTEGIPQPPPMPAELPVTGGADEFEGETIMDVPEGQ